MQILKIYLKQLLPHFFLMLIIVVGQLAAMHMNQLFVNSTIPPTALQVYVEKETPLTAELMAKLAETPEVSIKRTPALNFEDLKTKDIQGILVVPANFDQEMLAGNNKVVKFYIASGIQNTTSINEAVATNLIQMKSELLLEKRLAEENISLTEQEQTELGQELLLDIKYLNNDQVADLGSNQTSIGIVTIFLMLAFLYGLSFLPGFDSRRLQLYSPKNLLKCQGISLFTLALLWSFELILFIFASHFVGKTIWPMEQIIILSAVLFYLLSFSLLLVNLNIRKLASFLFVPWLLLNLTLGGGLWSIPTTNNWLYPLLPVAMALSQQTTTIIASTLILLILNLGIIWQKNRLLAAGFTKE